MSGVLLELRGVLIRDGERLLVGPLDLTLRSGERLAIFGPSGAGKTALLKVIAGAIEPDGGTVILGLALTGLRSPMGYVTAYGGLLNNLTLEQNAALPAVYHRTLRMGEALTEARALLGELGAKAVSRRPSAATVQDRRLTQLARASMARPGLFVLNEPFDDLDARAAQSVRRFLDRLRADGGSAVVATTSLKPYADWADRFLLILPGHAKLFASRAELMADQDPEVRFFADEGG
ncbi:MAG: ATP-binding cassette domain-containing protein [Elusimicrobia bacterium]|nr:ATP-binding cassette domain-containing protein [Elusimicrobiota bacterium]